MTQRKLSTLIRFGALAVVALMLSVTRAWAEDASAPPTPVFGAVSIKPNRSGIGFGIRVTPGRVTAANTSLLQLISVAYQVQAFQIVGGPNWLQSDRFDVVATVDDSTTTPPAFGMSESVRGMLRALLADRFKLLLKHETRDIPAYSLVVARSDLALGPQLRASDRDCAQNVAGIPAPATPSKVEPSVPLACGFRGLPGMIQMGSLPIAQLASSLSQILGRLVLDNTGLAGRFDAELKWAPDQGPSQIGSASTLDSSAVSTNQDPPSIFTALREQLGLKLDPTRAPFQVIVVESVQHPAED